MTLLDPLQLSLFCDSVQWLLFSCASDQCQKWVCIVWEKPQSYTKYSLLLLIMLLVTDKLCEPFGIYFHWASYFEMYFGIILQKQNFTFPTTEWLNNADFLGLPSQERRFSSLIIFMVSSRHIPSSPGLSWIENARTGCSTPDGISQGQSSREKSTLLSWCLPLLHFKETLRKCCYKGQIFHIIFSPVFSLKV